MSKHKAEPPPIGDHLLTLQEAAAVLRLTARTVHEYVRCGEIQGRIVGRRWRFRRAVLDALTGIAYVDDAQVCESRVVMNLCSPARVEIRVSTPSQGVPKSPRNHAPQLVETAHAAGGEIGVPKTHDFGRAG